MGLVMLDLDGTLVADAIVEVDTPTGTKLQRHQHERFHEPRLQANVYDTLHELARQEDSFAIVTNQGGVAWGYHTQAEVYQRIGATVAQLSFFWGRPFSVHVAFMHPKATLPQFKGDDGRKPADEMLAAALVGHGAGLDESVMVGDRGEDEEAAKAAGVTFTPAFQFFDW
jgi:HAD superfamily hydrolase (TIGR01662 family)